MFRKVGELIRKGYLRGNLPRVSKVIPKRYSSALCTFKLFGKMLEQKSLRNPFSVAIFGFVLFFIMSAAGQNTGYPVGPGDTLYISIWGQDNLSGPVIVGPDGNIVLPPPVGSIYVNQLTADEIARLLTEKLEEYVKQPIVMVSIREFQGFIVHVLGQVKLPGFYRIPDGTSVQELITQANGFTELADPESIILIHREDGKAERREIDFSKFLQYNDMESNPVLKANDVVLVPKADVAEKVRRLVTVIGQVGVPGTYELEVPMPLLDVLTLAGGVSIGADLRSIFVLSRSEEDTETTRQVNLEALLSGEVDLRTLGPAISPGEIVFVPNIRIFEERTFSVNVVGKVASPGSHKINEGERLVDAVFKAGGLTEDASIDNLSIIHSDGGSSGISVFSLKDYLLTGNMEANPVLNEGDTIVVPMIRSAGVIPPVQTAFFSPINVSVIGAVAKPGSYQLSAESSLLDVLVLAGGPASGADLERTIIIRDENAPSPEGEKRFEVDLKALMVEGNVDPMPVMFSGDTIFLPAKKEGQNWWRTVIQIAGDIGTLVVLYYLIAGKTYRNL